MLDAEDEEDESSDSADSAAGRPLDSPDTEDLELLSLALDFFLFRIRGLAFALAWSFGEAFATELWRQHRLVKQHLLQHPILRLFAPGQLEAGQATPQACAKEALLVKHHLL